MEHDVELAVAVEVADRRVAGAIALDRLNRDFEVAFLPRDGGLGGLLLLAIDDGSHDVGERTGGGSAVVDEVRGPGERLRVHAFDGVARRSGGRR